MNIKVISFYSPRYSSYATALRESCRRWDIDAEIVPVKEFRSWHDGVSDKPRFIGQQLEVFRNYDGILWVDADACFVRRPDWEFLRSADIAATRFQWSKGHRLELLTGTIYFANNPRVKTLIYEWEREVIRHTASDTPEQDALLPLIHAWKHSIVFEPLGIEWTFIDDDRVREQFPHAIPAILHKQASRQIRAEEFRRDQATQKK